MSAELNTEHFLGFGLGLRPPHFDHILEHRPAVDWFEIISENFMVGGGKPRHYLQQIREHYPVVMHGVSLSIGSSDPLDMEYLKKLRTLAADIEPAWISDHLCWTGINGINSHDLLPLPYHEESLKHVTERVQQVQEFLGRQILLENPSSYLDFKSSAMSEVDFLLEVASRADCLVLLDINNIYVSARNHGFVAEDYMNKAPPARVRQFHLAGHSDYGDYVIDTHDQDVRDEVWALYEKAVRRFGAVSTMIERDGNIPPFAELESELDAARRIFARNRPVEQAA